MPPDLIAPIACSLVAFLVVVNLPHGFRDDPKAAWIAIRGQAYRWLCRRGGMSE